MPDRGRATSQTRTAAVHRFDPVRTAADNKESTDEVDLPRPRPEPHHHRSPSVPRVLRLDVGGDGMSYQTCTVFIDLVDAWFAEHDEMDRTRYLALVDEARAVAS